MGLSLQCLLCDDDCHCYSLSTHCPLTVTLTPPAYITFLVRTTCSADVTGSETGGSARQWCTLSLRGLPLLLC